MKVKVESEPELKAESEPGPELEEAPAPEEGEEGGGVISNQREPHGAESGKEIRI